jgi:hypothetical protein
MILINTKTNIGYSNVCKAEAARMVGVHVNTIHRWGKAKEYDHYNHWIIYFNEIKLKQAKGNSMFTPTKQPKTSKR